MVQFWITITILLLLLVTAGTAFCLRRFSHSLDDSRQEREAWQQAQEGRQRTWEVRQAKHILETEKKLADQLKDARREWRDWNAQLQQDHQEWRADVDLEKELTGLPLIEHLELAHQGSNGRIKPNNWHPAAFYKADLRGRDLSYRYMERADLREAQMTETNLCMADLLGASMVGADLQRANLLGANLSGVDLRGANLSGADLMVADLHNAVLHGANLSGARNLTAEQLQTAIYDSTTSIDSSIDITLPRIPSVATTPSQLLTGTAEPQTPISTTEVVDASTFEPAADELPAPLTPDEQKSGDSSESADIILPVETKVAASVTPAPVATSTQTAPEADTSQATAESDSAVQVPSTEQSEVQAATPAPAPAPAKKAGASRKRTSKAKQLAASTPTSSDQDATAVQQEADASEDADDIIEETALPNKIIQWPTRPSKTNPLSNTGEQTKGEKGQISRANAQTTPFNEASEEIEDQHAQAN